MINSREKIRIVLVAGAGAGSRLDAVRKLFIEYSQSLDISLCFQGFNEELASLPGAYASSRSALFLATVDGSPAGCAGVRPLNAQRCEMKRLYVRPRFRAMGLGRGLAEQAIAAARSKDYREMVLDTLPSSMGAARTLYARLAFKPCAPYYDNTAIRSECLSLAL